MMEGEVEEQLRNRIVDIVRSLQSKLLSTFRGLYTEQGSPGWDASLRPEGKKSEGSTSTPDPAAETTLDFDILESGGLGFPDFNDFVFDGSLSLHGAGSDSGYGSKEFHCFSFEDEASKSP